MPLGRARNPLFHMGLMILPRPPPNASAHLCVLLRSLHWSDVHRMLLRALPQGIVHMATTVTCTEQIPGTERVRVLAERRPGRGGGAAEGDGEDPERLEVECDLLVAADGSMSDTRKRLFPNEARRCSSAPRSSHTRHGALQIHSPHGSARTGTHLKLARWLQASY
jgi:2-polyprenyl-6-methoxyphenol hydroxylase-like FAD-dependent oxidoreductase